MCEAADSKDVKKPSLALSLVPLAFLVLALVVNVILFKDDATYGPNQLALLLSGMLTLALGSLILKVPYKKMEDRIVNSISLATQACLILLVVGSLISVWILSGIVPTMIYYGLNIINLIIFYQWLASPVLLLQFLLVPVGAHLVLWVWRLLELGRL